MDTYTQKEQSTLKSKTKQKSKKSSIGNSSIEIFSIGKSSSEIFSIGKSIISPKETTLDYTHLYPPNSKKRSRISSIASTAASENCSFEERTKDFFSKKITAKKKFSLFQAKPQIAKIEEKEFLKIFKFLANEEFSYLKKKSESQGRKKISIEISDFQSDYENLLKKFLQRFSKILKYGQKSKYLWFYAFWLAKKCLKKLQNSVNFGDIEYIFWTCFIISGKSLGDFDFFPFSQISEILKIPIGLLKKTEKWILVDLLNFNIGAGLIDIRFMFEIEEELSTF